MEKPNIKCWCWPPGSCKRCKGASRAIPEDWITPPDLRDDLKPEEGTVYISDMDSVTVDFVGMGMVIEAKDPYDVEFGMPSNPGIEVLPESDEIGNDFEPDYINDSDPGYANEIIVGHTVRCYLTGERDVIFSEPRRELRTMPSQLDIV
jgi:hypothetical protein